eukprot:COSAG05_NODE_921_length_6590_cov_2.081985_4_plen_48_part_00
MEEGKGEETYSVHVDLEFGGRAVDENGAGYSVATAAYADGGIAVQAG